MNKIKFLLCLALLVSGVEGKGQIYINSYRFGQAQLFLDLYPNAAAAYSFRKLNSSYAGNCIQVRRSSDNTTSNIGFVDNYLDTAAMKTFCGSNSCFISIWYDQSGNTADVSQSTTTAQPRIVNAGVIDYFNGEVSTVFDGSDRLFRTTGFFSGASNRSAIIVYRPNNSTGTFTYTSFSQAQSTTTGSWTAIQSRTEFVVGDPYFAGYSSDLGNGLTTPNTLIKLAEFYYNGTAGSLYRNNTLITSGNITLNATSTDDFQIGSAFGASAQDFFRGDIQEVIIYTSNQSSTRSDMALNINTFYGIY